MAKKQEKQYHTKCPKGHANEYILREICADGATVYRGDGGDKRCPDPNQDRLRFTCKVCYEQWVECVTCRGY